jgi:formate hydrogenlyase subunit 6/NADH:ubiquinone oxidoreductase subunit I
MKKPGKMIAEVLAHVLKKPATENYPFTKTPKPDKFRGKLMFHAEKCIGCKICMKDCPSNAITINKVGDKQFEAILDLDKCIYCAQCVDSCPKKALETSKEFELATLDRSKLKVKINVPVEPENDTKK